MTIPQGSSQSFYHVVRARDLDTLIEKVNSLLEKGYTVQGGIAIENPNSSSDECYCQAVLVTITPTPL